MGTLEVNAIIISVSVIISLIGIMTTPLWLFFLSERRKAREEILLIAKSIRDTYTDAHFDQMTKGRRELIDEKYHDLKFKIYLYYDIKLNYDFTSETFELFISKLIVFYENHTIKKPPFTELI